MKKDFAYKLIAAFICCLICNLPTYAIRIGIQPNVKSAYVASSTGGSICDKQSGQKLFTITPMKKYILLKQGTDIILSVDRHSYNLGSKPLTVRCDTLGFVSAKNRWYRGNIDILPTSSGITVINNVDLENYIKGVVPSGMPRKWNIEAHKAQAIAARSYAIANQKKRNSQGYDLKDTPEDQAYRGASAESQQTNYAVEITKGQVLVSGNKIIPAYYSASAGGYTVNSGSVWGKNLSFLREVPSFDGNVPKHGHGIGMSQVGANNLANMGYNAYQILGYFYRNVGLYTLPSNYYY